MFYHASPVGGIKELRPNISNHGMPLVYLSAKPENTLVYLSNAVEKFCKTANYNHSGSWYKWASYGFNKEGVLVLDEYYPNATVDTYSKVSGYIYTVESATSIKPLKDIPDAYITSEPVKVSGCVYVPDAYQALLSAAADGKIIMRRYEENSQKMLDWIERAIKEDYSSTEHMEYRYFLKAHFPFLSE